jgi:EmrB/QacA subfamily drug resistance transporter
MEEGYSSRVRWAGLVAAASGVFLTALDITVNVALPDITDSFGTDAVTIQWIIIFYVGSSTGMQLGLGGAADAFGLRRMFLLGLVSYTVAVLAIGLSDSLELVFGLRVFQAVGNGLLIALGPAIVTSLFPAEFRGRALGIMAALGTLGMVSGSLGGGALVDALGWRAIFLARVPLCLLAIGFSAFFLRVPGRQRTLARFDLLGSVALFVSVGSLILALSLGGRNGWTELYVLALAALSACGFGTFVVVERRVSNPILRLSLLRHRVLAPALVVSLLVFISTFVNWFILPFFVIESLGASASVWGLLLMLMTAANSVSAPLGGWLSDRANPAYTITASVMVSTLAMLVMSRLGEGSSVVSVGLGLMMVGVGTGLFQTSSANLIMGSVPPDRLGMGGGIMGLARGMGTVTSVAIMGAVFAARESSRGMSATPDAAFIPAYRDTYLVAVVLAAVAVVVSFSLWPRVAWRSNSSV